MTKTKNVFGFGRKKLLVLVKQIFGCGQKMFWPIFSVLVESFWFWSKTICWRWSIFLVLVFFLFWSFFYFGDEGLETLMACAMDLKHFLLHFQKLFLDVFFNVQRNCMIPFFLRPVFLFRLCNCFGWFNFFYVI